MPELSPAPFLVILLFFLTLRLFLPFRSSLFLGLVPALSFFPALWLVLTFSFFLTLWLFPALLLFLTLFPFQQEDSSPNANYGKNDVAYPPALPERILVHILGAVT